MPNDGIKKRNRNLAVIITMPVLLLAAATVAISVIVVFPQSGERISGKHNIYELRTHYPPIKMNTTMSMICRRQKFFTIKEDGHR